MSRHSFRVCPVTSCRVAYTAPNKQRRHGAGQVDEKDLEGAGVAQLRQCHYACLEGLKKPTKYATQNSRDSKPGSSLQGKKRNIVMKGSMWKN
jgi:hypothetical protein